MARKRAGEEEASPKGSKRMKQTTLTNVFLGKLVKEPTKTVKVAGRLDKKNKPSVAAKETHKDGTLSNVRSFFNHAKKINPERPLEAFVQLKNARLCGFFERIGGEMEGKDDTEIRLHCRHTTDLPEMMTCCEYDGGRYAIWRDDPNQKEVLFVHVPNDDHFPAIQVVGDRFEHVLYHLGGRDSAALKRLLPEECDLQNIYKEVQEVMKQRNKKKLGNLPNGVGIWVPVRNNVGYRELGENTQELKKILTTIGTSDSFNAKKKAEERLTELCAHATMANDELDFGMSLELGHFLWLANYPVLNKRARQLMVCAYNLLERQDYVDIVKDHFEERDALNKKQIEDNIKAATATLNKQPLSVTMPTRSLL